MLRKLNVVSDKPDQFAVTSAQLTNGMVVSKDYATGKISAATGAGDYFVEAQKNYDGLNAVVAPTDGDFETIKSGETAILIPTYVGERYATSACATGLTVGDPLTVTSGAFAKQSAKSAAYQWVYGGTYSDPTGTLYIVEKIPASTTAAS